jgi:hypothetical protein
MTLILCFCMLKCIHEDVLLLVNLKKTLPPGVTLAPGVYPFAVNNNNNNNYYYYYVCIFKYVTRT